MAITDLAKRLKAAHLTEEDIVRRLNLHASIVDRVFRGEMAGTATEKKVVAALDAWERDGLPDLPRERWEVQRDAELQEGTLEWQLRQAKEQEAIRDAFLAERDAEDARRREEREAAVRARTAARGELAIELRRLREIAGLTQVEMAAIVSVRPEMLSRMEQGVPVGVNTNPILAGYRAAAELRSKGAGGTK